MLCITMQEAKEYASSMKLPLFETSAKTGDGVIQLFDDLGALLFHVEIVLVLEAWSLRRS